MSTITGESIAFAYRDQSVSVPVFEHLDFEFKDGEFISIVGHSGCGKSTLLRLVAGLEDADSGRVAIDGVQVKGPGYDRAIVFQQYPLFPWMKVRENVAFGVIHNGREVPKPEAYRVADTALERVEMEQYAALYPFQLSGGMAQRVAIARALAMEPEILLLDEPFGALDERRRRNLQALLEALWMESSAVKNVIFVTHDIDEAILLADRVVFMNEGCIEADIKVNIERPRCASRMVVNSELESLRSKLIELFYAGGRAERDEDIL